jgi:hypothetical protein
VVLPFSSSLAYLRALTWHRKDVSCISSALVGSSGISGGNNPPSRASLSLQLERLHHVQNLHCTNLMSMSEWLSQRFQCLKRDLGDLSKRFYKQLPCNQQDLNTLAAFRRSWGLSCRLSSLFCVSRNDEEDWTKWVHEILNGFQYKPDSGPDSKQLSLGVVLGWSPLRITIVVLGPVLLSLLVGLWFELRNWIDLATIQTAWGMAS